MSSNKCNRDDGFLLERVIRQKDKQALNALYKKYYLLLEQYFIRRIYLREDALDLAQNVFLELWKGNGKYDPSCKVGNYLFGVAKHILHRYYRTCKKQPKTISLNSVEGQIPITFANPSNAEDPFVKQEIFSDLQIALKQSLGQMPPKAAEAIYLRFIRGLSSKEAAHQANCSINTFYQRIFQAVVALKKLPSLPVIIQDLHQISPDAEKKPKVTRS